jgi:hypothetical protein
LMVVHGIAMPWSAYRFSLAFNQRFADHVARGMQPCAAYGVHRHAAGHYVRESKHDPRTPARRTAAAARPPHRDRCACRRHGLRRRRGLHQLSPRTPKARFTAVP